MLRLQRIIQILPQLVTWLVMSGGNVNLMEQLLFFTTHNLPYDKLWQTLCNFLRS